MHPYDGFGDLTLMHSKMDFGIYTHACQDGFGDLQLMHS